MNKLATESLYSDQFLCILSIDIEEHLKYAKFNLFFIISWILYYFNQIRAEFENTITL